MTNIGVRELARLSRSCRQEENLIGFGRQAADRPLVVRRKIHGITVAQPNGRRAVQVAEKRPIVIAAVLVAKKKRLAVGGKSRSIRPVHPGEIAAFRMVGSEHHKFETLVGYIEQNVTV